MQKNLIADADLLENYIKESGVKISFICEKLGISPQAFYKKRKGLSPFTASEIFALCLITRIPDTDRPKIFCPKG